MKQRPASYVTSSLVSDFGYRVRSLNFNGSIIQISNREYFALEFKLFQIPWENLIFAT